jgi:hypothetical protein
MRDFCNCDGEIFFCVYVTPLLLDSPFPRTRARPLKTSQEFHGSDPICYGKAVQTQITSCLPAFYLRYQYISAGRIIKTYFITNIPIRLSAL